MTLGQRIQELRKQRKMSQEALGSALGVSRQAVSKWEGDNGIPELDTLIAMSRLFDVTVGQLLGIEESVERKQETASEAAEDQADRVEAVLRRYVEQTAAKSSRPWLSQWGWRVSVAVAAAVFVVMFSMLGSLRSTVRLLRSDLSSLQVNVSNNQNNLSALEDTVPLRIQQRLQIGAAAGNKYRNARLIRHGSPPSASRCSARAEACRPRHCRK